MSASTRTEIIDALPFAEYQAATGISKSFLDEFVRCPLAGYEYMSRGGDAPTKAMIIGSAVDCLVCEPEQFATRFYIRPETYESSDGEKPWNGNSKVCREWLASHRNKPVLSPDEHAEALAISEAVMSDPKAARLFAGCKVQQSVFWVDSTGLQLKGRPDMVGDGYAIDLKVTRDATERAISRALHEYRYHIQAALYRDGLKANGRHCEEFYFVFVESGDSPKCNVRRLKDEAIDLGRLVYSQELLAVKECMERNSWPGYSGAGDSVLEIDVPAYAYTNLLGPSVTLKIGGQDLPI